MSDYLIEQYNLRIAAALATKETEIAAAVDKWLQESAVAHAELTAAMEHRNQCYHQGPPPAETTVETAPQAAQALGDARVSVPMPKLPLLKHEIVLLEKLSRGETLEWEAAIGAATEELEARGYVADGAVTDAGRAYLERQRVS